jgi:predicted transcriptional regulator
LDFVTIIGKIASKTAPGRAPSFNETQVIRALEVIRANQPVGRKRLSEELGLGEGVVRTLLRHTKDSKIIKFSKNGIALSANGQKLFSCIRSRISGTIEVPKSPMTVGPSNAGILVKNIAHQVRTGIEQRDASLKAGASGATTFVFLRKKLVMPGNKEDVFKDNPDIREMLMSKLRPKENDVIIIGSGQNLRHAEFGAIMAAFELLKSNEQMLVEQSE